MSAAVERMQYACWCDGTACSNPADEPFAVCDECRKFGHRPLPRMGLTPADVVIETEQSTEIDAPE